MVETTSKAIIAKLRQQFARQGNTSYVANRQWSSVVSKEACQFSNEWELEHRTSSPYYPQSNGKAESAVKVVKHLMTKALTDGRDPWLSLLELRNTPTVRMSASPARRLLSKRTRAILPIKDDMLRPELVTEASEQWQKKQEKQAKY